MIDFIGRYTWEELCREWVLRTSAFGDLPVMSDHIGSAWNSKVQIDVAGISSMKKTLVLGECKWTLSKSERKVIADLIEESSQNHLCPGEVEGLFPGVFTQRVDIWCTCLST